MPAPRPLSAVAVLLAATGVLAACDAQQQVADLDQTLVQTAVSTQGQAALMAKDVQVSGPLSCRSSQAAGGTVDVTCSATSLDGRQVQLTGTVTALIGGTSPKGTFTATVNGQQVLSADCLGTCS